jgi:hypothetical protein
MKETLAGFSYNIKSYSVAASMASEFLLVGLDALVVFCLVGETVGTVAEPAAPTPRASNVRPHIPSPRELARAHV